jgi:hypothetical protein
MLGVYKTCYWEMSEWPAHVQILDKGPSSIYADGITYDID